MYLYDGLWETIDLKALPALPQCLSDCTNTLLSWLWFVMVTATERQRGLAELIMKLATELTDSKVIIKYACCCPGWHSYIHNYPAVD